MASGERVGRLVVAIACLWGAAGCGSSLATSGTGDDAAGGGTCSANVPQGQACNTVTNVGAVVTPTCLEGTVPAGTGGIIVDGTYTVTAQTYYNVTSCPADTVSATLEIAGGCIQEVTSFQETSGSTISLTTSSTYTTSGATFAVTPTCLDLGADGGPLSRDAGAPTFTATLTTLTFFVKNSGTTSPNPDRSETYQKR